MSRITIFSLTTCPHCKRAKELIKSKGWEYYDVSLSDYPEKRSDMLKLANRLTVPQIFFGNKHIGGASDLEDLLDGTPGTDSDAIYKDLVANVKEPLNPLLERPKYAPKVEEPPSERAKEYITIGDYKGSYVDTVSKLESELDIKDRTYRLKTYTKCFTGKNLVDTILKIGGDSVVSREEAIEIGNGLLRLQLLSHVVDEHPVKDEDLFYRLDKDKKMMVLNSYREWTDRVDPDPLRTLLALKKRIGNLVSKYTDAADGLVDYESLANDPDFKAFEESSCELQKVDMGKFSREQMLAFGINLYNMMISHAFAKVGAPTTNLQRSTFFGKVSYNVGGNVYSFTDLENGLLRGNKTPPYSLSKRIGSNDPRAKYVVEGGEPRIHFALNCGAKSCPPVKKFTAEAVDEELRVVAMAFLEQDDNCRFNKETNTVYLSKIFQWYKSDFGSSNNEMVATLTKWLRDEKFDQIQSALTNGSIKVKFNTYDWGNNAKPRSGDVAQTQGTQIGGCIMM